VQRLKFLFHAPRRLIRNRHGKSAAPAKARTRKEPLRTKHLFAVERIAKRDNGFRIPRHLKSRAKKQSVAVFASFKQIDQASNVRRPRVRLFASSSPIKKTRLRAHFQPKACGKSVVFEKTKEFSNLQDF
jgi:hypothetical protein